MENEYPSKKLKSPFSFLEEEEVQRHFANLNIALLRGKHIQRDDYYNFQLLDKYTDELSHYYHFLYHLNLQQDKKDNELYYYLDFPEDGKGKVSSSSRHKELTSEQTIIGIMLLNIYYERFFEYHKEVSLEDIQKEITEGENSSLYKKLLFNDIRDNYTEQEWDIVKKWLRRALREFHRLGWIKILPPQNREGIHFLLKESIHRFAKLYEKEIQNFDQFVEVYDSRKQE